VRIGAVEERNTLADVRKLPMGVVTMLIGALAHDRDEAGWEIGEVKAMVERSMGAAAIWMVSSPFIKSDLSNLLAIGFEHQFGLMYTDVVSMRDRNEWLPILEQNLTNVVHYLMEM
jgi:hypothetical protein